MMLLPPLLPVITAELRISYTEIGLALTVYSFVSALTQTPMGFLVDRFGAARILVCGVALEGLAFGLIGVFPSFAALLFLLGTAGIANAVYHPADYSILNQVVPASRIGKAFSYHTASGLFGEALAPACILVLSAFLGWRIALVVCGLAGIGVALVLLSNLTLFSVSSVNTHTKKTSTGMTLLFSSPIVLGLLFFVGISLVSRGVNGFSVAELHEGWGMPLGTAGLLLSAWLFAAPLGVLAGGRIADKHDNHAALISGCFFLVAICLAMLAWWNPPVVVSSVLFIIGGFCAGVVSPSRDMLIRSITPPGQSGKVFGFVSTGFNIGGMLAPPIYGYLVDQQFANGVFWLASFASLLTIATVHSAKRISTNRHAGLT